jgi:hypothetical protein
VWSDDTELIEAETPVRVEYRIMYTLTRHNLPNVPQNIMDLTGKVNASPVTPILVGMDAMTFAADTLLMTSPVLSLSSEDDAANDGRVSYDLTMRMLWKSETWYKYWKADAEDYLNLHHRNTDGRAGAKYEQPGRADFDIAFP